MKLDELAEGEVYCDVNVFYMFLRRDPVHHATIRAFFKRMVGSEIEVYTSVLTMDELFYRLLLAKVKETYDRNPLDVLGEDLIEAITRCADDVKQALARLVGLPHLHMVGVEETDFTPVLDNITSHALLPRDALHLAVMQRLGLVHIATDDGDFDRVDWLERHWVFNPPQAD